MDANTVIEGFARNMAKIASIPRSYSAFLISSMKSVPGVEFVGVNSTSSGAEGRFTFENRTYRVTIEPEREGS